MCGSLQLLLNTMSQYSLIYPLGYGPPPPYYGAPPPWSPPHPLGHSPHPFSQYSTNPGNLHPPAPYPYFVPETMMMLPVLIAPKPAETPSQVTYITNYIYHGVSPSMPATTDSVQAEETSEDFYWVPSTITTASTLSDKVVVGGHEWNGTPLLVIRAWHSGDLIPGKLSVKYDAAKIAYHGREIQVQDFEVLCCKPDSLKWVPATFGIVPPRAIPGGKTISGETLYIGRSKYQQSLTPGRVQPSHDSCYIGFAGNEVKHRQYDVLCQRENN